MVPGLVLPPSLPAAKMGRKSGFSQAYRSTWSWEGRRDQTDVGGLQCDLAFLATHALACRGWPAAKLHQEVYQCCCPPRTCRARKS